MPLLVVPQDSLQRYVDQAIEKLSKQYRFDGYTYHFAKIGRQYDFEVSILVKDEVYWTTKRQDTIRHLLLEALGEELGDTWLSVTFTAQERWL